MSAETGVGPAMASGNQMYSGNCALFPEQPRNRNSAIVNRTGAPTGSNDNAACAVVKSRDYVVAQMRKIATRKPKSPMRLTMKAFFPASAFAFSLNQNPISRYDASPTPSHPTKSTA